MNEEISRSLSSIKQSLTGEGSEFEASSDVIAQVANEVYAQDLLSLMVTHMGLFEFEVSCDVATCEGFSSLSSLGPERHLHHL